MMKLLKKLLGLSRHEHYETDSRESLVKMMRDSLTYDESRLAEIEAEIALRQRGNRHEHP